MIHRSLLRYRGARYLWGSLALVAACGVLYATQGDRQPPNGGTWQGYVLGTIAALLILWLTLLAIRKRSYRSTLGTVQGWTSAHVYLGAALLIVATLHSGVQVGWNLHTLAYALMCIVIGSGFFGLYSYINHPQLIAKNREGGGRAELFAELFELDKQARTLSQKCAPGVAIAVDSSIERSTLGGGIYAQLFSVDRSFFIRGENSGLVRNADQQQVIDFVAQRLPRAEKSAEAATLQQLIVLLCRRQAVLRRIRHDIRLRGWLKIWLYFHVPLTVALLVALVLHILATFFYW